MSNVKKNSLKHVFLSESEEPKSAKNVVNPPMDKAPNTSKTDKNVAAIAGKKKVKDVNKELEDYKSILEGPFDDAFASHEKSIEDKKVAAEKEKSKKNLTKLDAPFSNNLKECPFDMDSPEHEAMETPEEEAMEHMPDGSEYGEEPVDHIIITVGHNADEEMEKTGQPAFNIGKNFGAAGSPDFKDGIDDNEHSLEETADLNNSSEEMSNMSLEELVDAGYSDEEILEYVRNLKNGTALKEVADSDENDVADTTDDHFENENEDLTMMQESFNPKRWQRLAGIKECSMNPMLKEMDPYNGLADDPKFDEDGMPVEDNEDEDKMNAYEDEKFSKNDVRSDRPGRK